MSVSSDWKTIIERFAKTHILVLGDFIIDEFVFGEITRVSREAPVLILKYQETETCPGGGANTVANIAALQSKVTPLGVIGDDEGADLLFSLWPEKVERGLVIRDDSAQTTRKVRILAGSFHSYKQQVVRLDYENSLKITSAHEERICNSLRELLPSADCLVISDYSLGNLSPRLRGEAIRLGRECGKPVIVDSRDNPHRYSGATSITPNFTEVEKSLGLKIGTNQERLDEIITEFSAYME